MKREIVNKNFAVGFAAGGKKAEKI